MNEKQLAELEVWLAAGFDLPTAMGAVQGVGEEDEAGDDPPRPQPASRPATWQYLLCLLLALGAILLFIH